MDDDKLAIKQLEKILNGNAIDVTWIYENEKDLFKARDVIMETYFQLNPTFHATAKDIYLLNSVIHLRLIQ